MHKRHLRKEKSLFGREAYCKEKYPHDGERMVGLGIVDPIKILKFGPYCVMLPPLR
jgi:hypothetical protein